MADKIKSIDELVQLTAAGYRVASFVEIHDSIVDVMKTIYGSDIDVSTGSDDGIFIYNLSLLVNNILQAFSKLVGNLNPQVASGIYLDILASLTNVVRKSATKSTVSLYLKNMTNSPIVINDTSALETRVTYPANQRFKLLDKAGVTWSVTSQNITLPPMSTWQSYGDDYLGETVEAECDEYGKIDAPVGRINQTVEVSGQIQVNQTQNCQLGANRETDNELRRRRNNSLATNSRTVTDGLVGSLLSIDGIEDCIIYNNNTTENIHTDIGDKTAILPHSIYVILRYGKYANVDPSIIGQNIYLKLTPGINTTAFAGGSTGTGLSFNNTNDIGVEQLVYWKKCTPIAPKIVITITPQNMFSSGFNSEGTFYDTSSTTYKIGQNVKDYVESLQINANITIFNLQSKVFYSDPKYLGNSTFTIKSITINGTATDYVNQDTYYEYSSIAYTKSGSDVVITLS